MDEWMNEWRTGWLYVYVHVYVHMYMHVWMYGCVDLNRHQRDARVGFAIDYSHWIVNVFVNYRWCSLTGCLPIINLFTIVILTLCNACASHYALCYSFTVNHCWWVLFLILINIASVICYHDLTFLSRV